jgi:hypothetical protein
MSSNALARWSGIALIFGAGVGIVGHLLGGGPGATRHTPVWIAAQFAMLIGGELVLLGLPAVYRRQSDRLGAFGLIAFVLLFGGMMRELVAPVSHLWMAELAARPETRSLVNVRAPLLFAAVVFVASQYVLGVVAFGVSVIRARVFPRGPGVLLIAGLVVENLTGVARIVLLDGAVFLDGGVFVLAALGWLGAELASSGALADPQTAFPPR